MLASAALLAGGMMGGSLLGGSSSGKVKIPGWVTTSMDDLLNLARSGTPSLPTQNIAGLSSAELTGQNILNEYLTKTESPTYDIARQKILDIINEPSDITKLPEYKAIVSTATDEGNEAVNQIMRRMQLQGMSYSTPQGKAVGQEISKTGARITKELAPFAEAERSRRTSLLNTLKGMGIYEEALPLQKVEASRQYGDLPRQINQAVLDATFNKQYAETMFPYTSGLNVYQAIMGSPASQPIVYPPSSSTGFSNAMGGANIMAQLLPYIMAGGSGGTSMSQNTLASMQQGGAAPWAGI